MHLVAQGFEADGGRGVTAEAAQLVSGMPFLVGYKPDGDLGYLRRGAARRVDLIAIDPHAQASAVAGLKLARLELRYVSVLMRQPNGTYRYESRRRKRRSRETPLAMAAAGHTLHACHRRSRQLRLVVRDAAGQQLARVDYQVAGAANLTRSLEKNAELRAHAGEAGLAPGEEIEAVDPRALRRAPASSPSSASGSTPGAGSRPRPRARCRRIRLPDGLEGNAYVIVTFVRDPGSREVFTSPLSLRRAAVLDRRRRADATR